MSLEGFDHSDTGEDDEDFVGDAEEEDEEFTEELTSSLTVSEQRTGSVQRDDEPMSALRLSK